MVTQNKQVIFAEKPTGYPVAGKHILVRNSTIDLHKSLADGEFIIKQLMLSVDPYMRGWMDHATTEDQPFCMTLGQPLRGNTMGICIRSNNPNFRQGDLVYGKFGTGSMEEYVLVPATKQDNYMVRNQPKTSGLPLSNYLGVLGMPGLTAYVGLKKYAEFKHGETLYISAASGAVGQLVGQMAKTLGLRVVGSAGTDNKVEYLKELKFDAAFNYKTRDLDTALKETCPDGIDIYFDNVGGKTLETVIRHANVHGRILACGSISQDSLEQPQGVCNLGLVVVKRLTIRGLTFLDGLEWAEQFEQDVTMWLQEGKIKYRETITDGIEKTPEALLDVLQGRNFGKQLVRVADL
ncbi:hypothetical protein BX666DRAFT_1848190 [Dichotomocladium elegans]|nr:hypothetical protein BX666DRAFT_1848190 [Dichotomocladium elegans]